VRQGPDVNSPIVATVAQGEIFEVMAVSPNTQWLQISPTGGMTGWISNRPPYVRVAGSLEGLKVEGSTLNLQPSAASATPPAGGRSSAAGGRLVFATSSGGDLYIVNIDGSDLRRLATGVIDPVVSPDGQQVAFTRWDGAKFGALYALNLNEGRERVVVGDIRQPKSPAWSPDGQSLILSFQHGGTVDPQPECREFDLDDGFQLPNVSEILSVRRKSNGNVEICFIRVEDLQWGLRRVDLATRQYEDLPADLYSFNPTWDPAQPWRLLYDGERGLMQLDLDSGRLTPFTTDVRDTAPVFSPDGQKLALTYKQHDHWEVYTYDLTSSARRRLTKPGLLERQYNSAAPAWSPDGSQLAFVTDRSGQWEIWVMNADGSNPHPLLPPEIQAQLGLDYRGVNERMLNWIP
jgi:dipeptidyl aminopeptidase/acylaminoacyl peptidase